MLNEDNCKIKWILVLQIYMSMDNLTNGHFIKKNWKDLNEKYIQWNLYKLNPEQTRNLSKPETCLNQTSSEVHSYQFQCILILCKPNTCINQTNPSVRKGFQQKWKYKKTFNSSGQSCVSNMKLFCPVVAETSVAQIVCRQTNNRLTWWLHYAPSYKWGYNS
jgi:hypothetical protein